MPFSTNSSSSIFFLPAASSNDSIPACKVCICSFNVRIKSLVQPERSASFASLDMPVHMSLISIQEFCSFVRISSKKAERTSLSVTESLALPWLRGVMSFFSWRCGGTAESTSRCSALLFSLIDREGLFHVIT